jgi:ribonuclease Z
MKASHILLNHFSQRYPKLPKLNLPADDGTGSKQADISISFDFMSIKVGEMWKMAYYMDALSLLFDEAEPEDGDDTTGAVEGGYQSNCRYTQW